MSANYKFSDEDLICRVWDVIEIKNVMGRHAYYHAYGQHREELEKIWVKEPENMKTASFGQNWGYQIGMDLIMDNYVTKNEISNRKTLEALSKKYPDIENIPENEGIGLMFIHTLTTPLVEVAEDGKTAQAMWYAPGHGASLDPERGCGAMWMYEKYAVDFIRESDEWKIWHLFVGTDFCLKPGADMSKEPVFPEPMGAWNDDEETNLVLTYPMTAYDTIYNWTDYPIIPKPYRTFSETVSNGPEGNPNFKKEG